MARKRIIRVRSEKRISLEWLGFRDGGIPGNLNTSTVFELVPPAGASAAVEHDVTHLRTVGNISFTAQSAVVAGTSLGAILFKGNVGADQAVDADVPPLSTDVDDFDNSGIMWWQTWQSLLPAGPAADFDEAAVVIPIDIRVKRRLSKRDNIQLRIDAGTTARARVSVNVRTLIRVY